MSHDDPYRPDQGRDRGAYTPPTDDDLPFGRGGFDPRRSGPRRAPPVTLIVSGLVLLGLIVAVVWMYTNGGLRASDDAPSVGDPVGAMKVEVPIDAQPIDPEAGVRVYPDGAEPIDQPPIFTPPPEAVQPRPAPRPTPPTGVPLPAPTPGTSPRPVPPVQPTPLPAPASAAGNAGVQIGAFSTPALADEQYAAMARRFPEFANGAGKRVQEVPTASGSTAYRTTFTGMSRERAQAFCAAIRSGGGDCLVR